MQLTAPSSELKLANRERGTVESIGENRMSLKLDGGRTVDTDTAKHPHLDHGYAVTSHSAQGQTADRVLIHVDTELAAKDCSITAWPMSPSPAARTMRSSLPMIVRD